jgi:hypothetical protein
VRRYIEALLSFDIAVNFSSGEGAGGGPLAFVSGMAGHSGGPDDQQEASGAGERYPRDERPNIHAPRLVEPFPTVGRVPTPSLVEALRAALQDVQNSEDIPEDKKQMVIKWLDRGIRITRLVQGSADITTRHLPPSS